MRDGATKPAVETANANKTTTMSLLIMIALPGNAALRLQFLTQNTVSKADSVRVPAPSNATAHFLPILACCGDHVPVRRIRFVSPGETSSLARVGPAFQAHSKTVRTRDN